MQSHQPAFVLIDASISIGESYLARSQAFHFAAVEQNSCFQRLLHKIVVASFAVGGHSLSVGLLVVGHLIVPSTCVHKATQEDDTIGLSNGLLLNCHKLMGVSARCHL